MMTFKQKLQQLQEQVQQAVNDANPLEGLPPALVTMTRQSVRNYPKMNVALYYAKQIRRYFTILYH
jgi:hypothetical protein